MRTATIATFIALLVILIPVCHAAEINLQYDANGNLVSGDGRYRVYNGLNQLWKVYNGSSESDPILEEYVYHPVEERVLMKKVYNTSDGSVLETVYYFSEENVRVVNSSGTYDYRYVYHAGQLVAQEVNGVRNYISGNHEGSSSVVTAVNQSVVESTEYSPFGEIVSGGTASRFGYEGQEYSSVTGDTDFHFRKYNPSWGLFMQPDTLIQNVYDPQMLNPYMFERGNPYRYTDPTGHFIRDYVFGGLIAVGIGVAAIALAPASAGIGIFVATCAVITGVATVIVGAVVPNDQRTAELDLAMTLAEPGAAAALPFFDEDDTTKDKLRKAKMGADVADLGMAAVGGIPRTAEQAVSAGLSAASIANRHSGGSSSTYDQKQTERINNLKAAVKEKSNKFMATYNSMVAKLKGHREKVLSRIKKSRSK